MGKYSGHQISIMAAEALRAKDIGDPRYQDLIFNLGVITGIDFNVIDSKIEEMSKLERF